MDYWQWLIIWTAIAGALAYLVQRAYRWFKQKDVPAACAGCLRSRQVRSRGPAADRLEQSTVKKV